MVVLQEHGARGADRHREFAQQGVRNILHRGGTAQQLADRVQQIDLFVAFREFAGGAIPLACEPTHLRHDARQQAIGARRVPRFHKKPANVFPRNDALRIQSLSTSPGNRVPCPDAALGAHREGRRRGTEKDG